MYVMYVMVERDGAGRTVDGAFDLHRPRWIKSWQRLSPRARLCEKEPHCQTTSISKSSTLSVGAPLFDNISKKEPDSVKRSPAVWQPLSSGARPTQGRSPTLKQTSKTSKNGKCTANICHENDWIKLVWCIVLSIDGCGRLLWWLNIMWSRMPMIEVNEMNVSDYANELSEWIQMNATDSSSNEFKWVA